jgi:peroxiredoxin
LVFLRHLGCLPCREHAAQLCQHQDDFVRLNTRVLIVSFGAFPAVQQWIRETCVTFDVLLDADRSVYQAYKLERSRWRSWNPRTLWTYFE